MSALHDHGGLMVIIGIFEDTCNYALISNRRGILQ